jgi:hypothetical protein
MPKFATVATVEVAVGREDQLLPFAGGAQSALFER